LVLLLGPAWVVSAARLLSPLPVLLFVGVVVAQACADEAAAAPLSDFLALTST
jgi:hypothetical protein